MVTRRTFVKGAVAAPLVGSALFAAPRFGRAQGDPVRIGSKDFTEQFILAEMYGLLLENAGIPFELNTNLGGTGIAHAALVNDEIDLYPEYTGTAYTFGGILGDEGLPFPPPSLSATPAAGTPMAEATPSADGAFSALDLEVYRIVSEEYKARFDLVWLEQTPFNDNQAIAVKRSFSEERGVTTLSQLAEIAGELTISAPSDFAERQDGLLGLQRVYDGGFADIELLAVAPELKYQAVENDEAQVVLAFGTDPQIADLDLIVLEDDKGLFPPGHVAPVVRQETLDAYPNLADALNAVAPLLTGEVMIGLNARAALEGEEAADVARSFLEEQGLISA